MTRELQPPSPPSKINQNKVDAFQFWVQSPHMSNNETQLTPLPSNVLAKIASVTPAQAAEWNATTEKTIYVVEIFASDFGSVDPPGFEAAQDLWEEAAQARL